MGASRIREPYEKHINFMEEIDFQSDAIGKYIDSVEQYAIPLSDQKRKNYEEEEEMLKGVGDDEYEYSFNGDLYIDDVIYSHFKNIFFANAIISIHSFLERTLLIACRANEKDHKVKIKDISGKGISKYRTYLEKVVGLDFQAIEEPWGEIIKLNKIRNHIAHDMDVQEENLNEIINIYKNLKGVEVSLVRKKYSILFSNVQFIREFNKNINEIIQHVFIEKVKF